MRIEFESLNNTRDLGGTPAVGGAAVRRGRLFRSGQLYPASATDRERLAQMGLGLVVDFRGDDEWARTPDPAVPGARNVHIPALKSVTTGISRGAQGDLRMMKYLSAEEAASADGVDAHMRAMYAGFVTDPFCARQYARFAGELVACVRRGHAALWHCTAGKDRAGFATAIVLGALGVPRDAVMQDYLETNLYMKDDIERICLQHADKLPKGVAFEALRHFFLADESYLAAALDAADREFGSFDAYLERALGVNPGTRDELRRALLE